MNTITYAHYVVKLKPLAWELAAAQLAPKGFVPVYLAPTERFKPLYGALGIVALPLQPNKKHPTGEALKALYGLRSCRGLLGYCQDTGYAPPLPPSFVPDMLTAAGVAEPPVNGILHLSLTKSEATEELSCSCDCHVAARRLRIQGLGGSRVEPRQRFKEGTPQPARTYTNLQRLANNPCDCCPNGRNRVPEFLSCVAGQSVQIHGLPNTRATYCKHTDTTVTVELHLLGRPCRVTLGHGQVYT